jgi:hypothetical protein
MTSDDTVQEVITFDAITFQLTGVDVYMKAPVFFCQLPGQPSFTDFVEPKAVVHC